VHPRLSPLRQQLPLPGSVLSMTGGPVDLERSYDEWLDFVFARPTSSFDATSQVFDHEPWYFSPEEWTCSSEILIRNLTRLFTSTETLVPRYSYEQIDHGFWFIPGPYGFTGALLDESVSWLSRSACIDAMKDLAEGVFCKDEMGSSVVMWWDSLITYSTFRGKAIPNDLLVTERIAQTISILAADEIACVREVGRHGVEYLRRLFRSAITSAARDVLIRAVPDLK
jgi:hypothetical protein